MALTSWKAFPFFTVQQVPVPADDEGTYVFNNEIVSIAPGPDSLYLGDSNGIVRVLSRAFKVVQSFAASDHPGVSITHIRHVPDSPYLITVEEDLSNEPVLKVWALDKLEKRTGTPKCLSKVDIQNGRRQFPVTALAVLDDLSQVAVGFANGSVTVIRGDLIHDRGTKQRIVYESEDPITGLEVRQGATKVLYIATTGRISSLIISGKGQGQQVRNVDNNGCNVGCMTVDPAAREVVVAREDAVYYYGPNGRGPNYAFDGPKKTVKVFKEYVALVCLPRVAQYTKSRTFHRPGTDEVDDLFSTSSFTLLETDLKYIAHTESLPAQVKDIFIAFDELFLLTIEGKLYRYQEKTLKQKLDILYQRNLYILAINLAQKSGIDTVQQNLIFRKYGDYLYQKGDYDTAMQQYLRAIDNTEPSQIIRKFLDTQRISNLVDYLEELHEHNKATADHTTLLLNCYAKLKDTEKLDAFIRQPGDIKFDLDTAIAMCRQGGYYEQAAYLATKHGANEMVIDILIEDSKKYAEALQYILRLPAQSAYEVLMKYAWVLVEHCPKETTQLFISYYTGKYEPKTDVPAVADIQPQSEGGTFENLSALWTALPYLSKATRAAPQSSTEVPETDDVVDDHKLQYAKPSPRTAFSAFISHPTEFITFLESLLRQPDLPEADQRDLTTTLFEMYLDKANKATNNEVTGDWQQKAKQLIAKNGQQSPPSAIMMDTSNVLLLSTLSNFATGTTMIRERTRLYADIFRSHTAAKDTHGVISALRKYGPEDPSLYPLALAYFASSERTLAEPGVQEELQTCLRRIDQERLMAPLQVVKILSQGGAVTMGMVKQYLAENINRERREIQSNRRLIDSYRSETANKRREIEDLNTKPIVFQAKRCSSCGGSLDLPVVHFLCKHSFHQRCLNTPSAGADAGQAECPLCKDGNDTIKSIRRMQLERTEQHDVFKTALARSTDRFATVGEFFGAGVMNVTNVAD